jgi:hypothetical protein
MPTDTIFGAKVADKRTQPPNSSTGPIKAGHEQLARHDKQQPVLSV